MFFPHSPCPSPTPTPLFQQIYQALGQIDRLTQDSPEALLSIGDVEKEKKLLQRSNSFSSANETAVETGNNRRQSYPLNIALVPTKVDIRINNKKC